MTSTGTVVTFYSYKGGVGRSFTLANVAVLLARWGYRVLAIDWDLEAPGLQHYFGPLLRRRPKGGVIDLAYDFLNGAKGPSAHAVRVDIDGGHLALLAAGREDDNYSRRVQGINWEDLYAQGFADFLERCRAKWTNDYDFVLIDSRTGISDIAGICTAHLPDRLVVVFTANQQSIDGVVRIAKQANAARDRLPYDRPPHFVLPILSRLDNRVEYERAEFWRRQAAESTEVLFSNWLDKNVTQELMLRHMTVPYVSYWSFGEQLPVHEEKTPSSDQISFALETVAAIIAQQFDRTDLLADNRDAYVAVARTHQQSYSLDLLVSVPRLESRVADELIRTMAALGLRVDRSQSGDLEFEQSSFPAKHLCLVVDGTLSRWQAVEAERFLRQTLDADGDRQLFCVLTSRTDPEALPPFLLNLRLFRLGEELLPLQVARQLHAIVTEEPPGRDGSDLATLEDVAAVLRTIPAEVSHPGRWALIEQTVDDLAAALHNDDLRLLKDLTVDLAQLNQVRSAGDRVTASDGLHARIGDLLDRVDRRIRVSTK